MKDAKCWDNGEPGNRANERLLGSSGRLEGQALPDAGTDVGLETWVRRQRLLPPSLHLSLIPRTKIVEEKNKFNPQDIPRPPHACCGVCAHTHVCKCADMLKISKEKQGKLKM